MCVHCCRIEILILFRFSTVAGAIILENGWMKFLFCFVLVSNFVSQIQFNFCFWEVTQALVLLLRKHELADWPVNSRAMALCKTSNSKDRNVEFNGSYSIIDHLVSFEFTSKSFKNSKSSNFNQILFWWILCWLAISKCTKTIFQLTFW